jgi:hypothetical protein
MPHGSVVWPAPGVPLVDGSEFCLALAHKRGVRAQPSGRADEAGEPLDVCHGQRALLLPQQPELSRMNL